MKLKETFIERGVTISIDFHSFKFGRGLSAEIETGETKEQVETRLIEMVNKEISNDIKENLPKMFQTANSLKKALGNGNGH